MRVTGERVTTSSAGFNPTWQRHVAAYALCERLLPAGRCLDLGCGIGHSYRRLAPRETVGVDIDARVLVTQNREVHAADMRSLPFHDSSFASILAVQSIEHVPDYERVLAEARRVLAPDGVAVFVTPNRLTFGHAGEIIDPYHHVEFAPWELRAACELSFDRVELWGIFGSDRYRLVSTRERARLKRLLRLDPLKLRRITPRRIRQRTYDLLLTQSRARPDPDATAIDISDFRLQRGPLELALDLVAVCSTNPQHGTTHGVAGCFLHRLAGAE